MAGQTRTGISTSSFRSARLPIWWTKVPQPSRTHSDTEIAELQAELPDLWQQYVEKLSEYMASTGKTYQNHAATIRRWVAEDRRKGKTIPDYTYKEGESL